MTPHMTGAQIALSAITAVGGSASVVTGGIVATTGIGGDTPVNLTLALVAGGITAVAVAAWKVSRAWSMMESKVAVLEAEVNTLKRGRAAELRKTLDELEHKAPDA